MTTAAPLAHQLRPTKLDEFFGQRHLLHTDSALARALNGGDLHSMIFWGPPGTGKTTLAMMLAQQHSAHFVSLSAVSCGVKDIRQVVAKAALARKGRPDVSEDQANQIPIGQTRDALAQDDNVLDSKQLSDEHKRSGEGRQTVLFLDEVHRFNKSQQDAFLPYIEDGTIIFVGATTENPSFALNNALLSRARVYVLKPLSEEDLKGILVRASERLALVDVLQEHHFEQLAVAADGDARRALGLLELLASALNEAPAIATDASEEDKQRESVRTPENHSAGAAAEHDEDQIDHLINDVVAGTVRRFDRGGDDFYDQISALHKAVRGSDPDAALYWLCRMLDGGCDPRYVLRRLIRMASEDIGNADPRALWIVTDCSAAFDRLGQPEGDLALAQAVIYLSCAPKSNAVYSAFNKAMESVRNAGSAPVPNHLRNAPTKLAKDLGHGAEYHYAHDYPGAFVAGEQYFPDDMTEQRYYHPVSRGLETQIAARLEELRRLNQKANTRKP